MREEVDALTGLRGIAALWVLLYHATYALFEIPGHVHAYLSWLTTTGYLGVDLFFVLSGFVIAFNYSDRSLHRSLRAYGAFLWKRLARLYPIHIAALVMIGILMLAHIALGIGFVSHSDMSMGSLLQSLLLIQAWELPARHIWNAASWSISAEWAAYIFFPVCALVAQSLKSRAALLASIGALFVCFALFVRSFQWNDTLAYAMPRTAVEFTAGVFLYRMYAMRVQAKSAVHDSVAGAALLVLILGTSTLDRRLGIGVSLLTAPILCCVVVYCLALASGPFQRFLSSSPMLYAGRISYATYMVHVPIVYSVQSALVQLNFNPSRTLTVFAMLGGVVGSVLLAAWLYRSIEVPARRYMLSLTSDKRPGLGRERALATR